MTPNEQASMEMPRYRCHKEVWALKIRDIFTDTDRKTWIVPENRRYGNFIVTDEYVTKHSPSIGGYYVVYKDGYKSFSPAEAFESGYTLIEL